MSRMKSQNILKATKYHIDQSLLASLEKRPQFQRKGSNHREDKEE
jgi:hypothetical protein